MIYKRVGQNIRDKRRKKSWTQKQLEAECGCSSNMICAIERGTRHCDLILLDKIAAALDCNFMDLIEKCDTHEANLKI